MMMRWRLILFVSLLMVLPLWAQQTPKKTPLTKKSTPHPAQPKKALTETQKRQVEVLKKIKELAKEGKRNQKLFFKAFYTPVKETCPELSENNLEMAEKLREQVSRALAENDEKKAQMYESARQLFSEAAEAVATIETAIAKGNTMKASQSLDDYVAIEKKLKSLNIKPVPRQWFSVGEAEAASYGK